MKKRFLLRMNVVLGALSMLFAGCHSQKNVTKTETDSPNQPKVEQTEPEVVEMYAVPNAEFERPVMKYGVPNMMR